MLQFVFARFSLALSLSLQGAKRISLPFNRLRTLHQKCRGVAMTDKLHQPTHPLFTARSESRNDLVRARSLLPGVLSVRERTSRHLGLSRNPLMRYNCFLHNAGEVAERLKAAVC